MNYYRFIPQDPIWHPRTHCELSVLENTVCHAYFYVRYTRIAYRYYPYFSSPLAISKLYWLFISFTVLSLSIYCWCVVDSFCFSSFYLSSGVSDVLHLKLRLSYFVQQLWRLTVTYSIFDGICFLFLNLQMQPFFGDFRSVSQSVFYG